MTRLSPAALFCLVACHPAMPPDPGPPAPRVHLLSLGVETDTVGLDVDVRLNDIPTFLSRSGTETFFGEMRTTLKSYQVMHPYFLRSGENVLTLTYAVDDGRDADYGPYVATYVIADVDYENRELVIPYGTLATRPLSKTEVPVPPETISTTFRALQTIPEWRWQHGVKITNDQASRDSLYAAYEKLWKQLDAADGKDKSYAPYAAIRYDIREFATACQMRDGEYKDWDAFFAVASTRQTAYQEPVFLERLPERDVTALRVFANGTLAYLAAEPGSFFEHPIYISIKGGAHDAPSGTMGPVNELIQPWFRRDDQGNWVVDGLTQ